MDIWIIGKLLKVNNKEIGWTAEGVYQTEDKAKIYCKENEFIVLSSINERLPEKAINARKLYYPRIETWEESKLYKIQNKTS